MGGPLRALRSNVHDVIAIEESLLALVGSIEEAGLILRMDEAHLERNLLQLVTGRLLLFQREN